MLSSAPEQGLLPRPNTRVSGPAEVIAPLCPCLRCCAALSLCNSEEWQGMTLLQKYEFFAPIWRVMRDDNMSVEEVQRQIEHVALAVKQGSQVRCAAAL